MNRPEAFSKKYEEYNNSASIAPHDNTYHPGYRPKAPPFPSYPYYANHPSQDEGFQAAEPSSAQRYPAAPPSFRMKNERPTNATPVAPSLPSRLLGTSPVFKQRPFSPGHKPVQQRGKSYSPTRSEQKRSDSLSPTNSDTPGSRHRSAGRLNVPDATHTEGADVQSTLDFAKREQFRLKLDKVLSNKDNFLKSSAASFEQFDRDGNGKLDFVEVKLLMQKLIRNLQLPPIDDQNLLTIFQKYQKPGYPYLGLSEFQTMYWELLHTVKDKFYPTRTMKVRRSSFVAQTQLQNEHQMQNLFSFEKRLGSGSFGEVFLVRERTSGLNRVCKVIEKDLSKVPIEQIKAEIDVLKRLDHPNIIKVFEVYQDARCIYIIMEICDGGELADRITKTYEAGSILTEMYVADIMRQLLEAVNYFHTKRVAHKDLKPENILFQSKAPDSPIKIIDFGLAELFERQTTYSHNAAGTYLYMAPEVLDYIVTFKCDIWSCGCIMFQLLTGEVPFPGTTLEEVEYKLRNYDPPYEKLSGLPVSQASVQLLQSMLTRDLNLRPSAQECLQHAWLWTARVSNVKVPKGICSNLKRYKKQPNLRNVLTNMLAHQLNVTGTQVREINTIFRSLDTDGDGHLSKRELATGLREAGFPPHEITQIIDALDIDGSDYVSYTEFLAACYTWRESELNLVWAAFNKMDRDGDGKITIDEFVTSLVDPVKSKDNNISSAPLASRIAGNVEELRKMASEVDRNKDGVIEWHEFLAYLRQI